MQSNYTYNKCVQCRNPRLIVHEIYHLLFKKSCINVRHCRGAMNKKELVPWCRRGLLAYVYNGVSD